MSERANVSEPVNQPTLRAVIVTQGGTGRAAGARLFQALPTPHKALVEIDTDHETASEWAAQTPEQRARSEAVITPVPELLRRLPAPGVHDDRAALHPFILDDRPYLAHPAGAEGAHEAAIAWIAASKPGHPRNPLEAISRAIQRVASVGREPDMVVDLVIIPFTGRATGSGQQPLLLGSLPELAADLKTNVRIQTTVAWQVPTVRVPEYVEYLKRSLMLTAEVEALAEAEIPLDARRFGGAWLRDDRLPFDDLLVFGDGAGQGGRQTGFETDTDAACRFLAAVLCQRLTKARAAISSAKGHWGQRHRLRSDTGTALARLFSASGLSELVFEHDAAAEHVYRSLRLAFYEAVAGAVQAGGSQ